MDYEDNTITFHVAVPWLYLFVNKSFRRTFRERRLSVAWFEGTVQLHLWTGDGDWHRDRPWHRNCVVLHVAEWFTGRPVCETTEGTPYETFVPLPEGCYRAIAKPERRTWTYRLGIKQVRDSVWLDIPGGIPFSGKGENSWDQGDDGLFGCGGDTLEGAIGNAVKTVLENRRRRGLDSKRTGAAPALVLNAWVDG